MFVRSFFLTSLRGNFSYLPTVEIPRSLPQFVGTFHSNLNMQAMQSDAADMENNNTQVGWLVGTYIDRLYFSVHPSPCSKCRYACLPSI